MKAVIMAGGEGTRLRPISLNIPKPMVRMFDKPVMEHIIGLLRGHNINQVAATLQFMPNMIRDYFGDGADFGVDMHYFVEHTPMGTAGGVAQCADFLGQDQFLVISGDAVCDFDLTHAIEFHKEHDADVTVLLYRHPRPLEYGLVMTDSDGVIERFIEKPSWAQVFTDTVNTGIYLIHPRVLREIPSDKPYDFARDLFPKLLSKGMKLYGYVAEGYWCDIGDPQAFLNCSFDVLAGSVQLNMPVPQRHPHIWSETQISDDIEIKPPVYIGKNVEIEAGAKIGPYTILEEGSRVGCNATVEHSILKAANIGERAQVHNSIVCAGVIAGAGSDLKFGSVIGENAYIGAGATIEEDIRIWSGVRIPEGELVCRNIIGGNAKTSLLFDDNGTISGVANVEITPEIAVNIGCAVVSCGTRIGVGYMKNGASEMAANAMIAGMCASGAQVTRIDAPFASAAAYVAKSYLFHLTVFIETENEKLHIRFYDKAGLPVERQTQRKIEGELSRGEFTRADTKGIMFPRNVSGILDAYVAWSVADRCARGLTVSVTGDDSANNVLRTALTMLGCRVTTERAGVPSFHLSSDGGILYITNEDGVEIEPEHTEALLALAFYESGNHDLAVRYTAPSAIEHVAARYDGRVIRIGRDGQVARAAFSQQKVLTDGMGSATFLCHYLAQSGRSVCELYGSIPEFSVMSCEVNITRDRGAMMRDLGESCRGMHRELSEGLRVCLDGGWVHISPSVSRRSLRITGEGMNEEIAAELCAMFEERARELDKK